MPVSSESDTKKWAESFLQKNFENEVDYTAKYDRYIGEEISEKIFFISFFAYLLFKIVLELAKTTMGINILRKEFSAMRLILINCLMS